MYYTVIKHNGHLRTLDRAVFIWVSKSTGNWFCVIATLHDWLKKFVPIFHPIRSKTRTNHGSFARVFLHCTSATCNFFEFWLVHCIACVLCDWLEQLLWFSFYDTQLKTTLNVENTRLQLVFSTFPSCSQMTIVFYHSVIHGLAFFMC